MPRRLIALACLACPVPAMPAAAGALRDSVPHVTVTGEASAEVVPDQADIRLGVSNERPTADAAAAATAAQATAVVEAIKAQGIAAADIRLNFSLAAEYDGATDPQTHVSRRTLRGYCARTQITVRLHDTAKAGSLARMLIDKGANSFEGIDYRYAGEKALRRRLRGDAARDAEAEARAFTEPLGLTLGRVLQIGGEAPASRVVSRFASAAGGDDRVAIPTEPGHQTVTESATITFEVEGKAR